MSQSAPLICTASYAAVADAIAAAATASAAAATAVAVAAAAAAATAATAAVAAPADAVIAAATAAGAAAAASAAAAAAAAAAAGPPQGSRFIVYPQHKKCHLLAPRVGKHTKATVMQKLHTLVFVQKLPRAFSIFGPGNF